MAAKRTSRKPKKPAENAKTVKAKATVKTKDNREFVAEAEEILERMFEDLSDLQEQRHAAGEVDPDLVNRISRSAHSLKGLAGMFGLDAISELSHHLEDILDGLRLGRISFDSPAIVLLDDGVSLLATLMTRLEQGEASGAEDAAAAKSFITKIHQAIAAPTAPIDDEFEGARTRSVHSPRSDRV